MTLDRTIRNPRFWQSSDGLASGNVLAEAILHGLLERIERDAEVLWDISEPKLRMGACIDPASLADPMLDELVAKISAAGLTLRLFDITSNIGIPVIVALLGPEDFARARHIRYLDVTIGSGAHPSLVRAAIRAVTEAAQSRLTFISGARDDIRPENFTREFAGQHPPLLRCHSENHRQIECDPAGWRRGAAANDHRPFAPGRHHFGHCAFPWRRLAPLAVAKLVVPQLENPAGDRKRRFGYRAISKTLQLL